MEVLLRKLGPVGISATLCLLLVMFAVVGFAVTRSDGGGEDHATLAPPSSFSAQPGTPASGETLACPGGGTAETAYSQVGSEFRIVGKVASVDGSRLLVKGPERYVKLEVADSAQGDAIAGGEIIKASGTLDAAGNALATEVEPACAATAAVVAVTAAPTADPTVAVALTPEIPFTVAPTPPTVPTRHRVAPTPGSVAAAGRHESDSSDREPTPRPTRTPEPSRRR